MPTVKKAIISINSYLYYIKVCISQYKFRWYRGDSFFVLYF
ncbi:hypothetical protein CNEO3_930018 [Clostridium neonatale]|nr:hypothetical protein CNEO3_930018 [Clostridium neonatale]